MNNEQLQMIFDKLDQVGLKLGETAETIWPWFIKQQYINGFSEICSWLISFIIMSFILKFSIKGIINDDDDGVEIAFAGSIISGIIILFLIISFVIDGGNTLSQIINPEFNALQELLSMVK